MTLPITFLSDYGVIDDFAGVCRAVIARIAPGRPGDRHHPRDRPPRRPPGLRRAGRRDPLRAGRRAPRDRRSRASAGPAARSPCAAPRTAGSSSAPTTGCCRPRSTASAERPRPSTSAPRPSASTRPRRRSTAATSSPPSPPTSPPARPWPRPGCRSTRATSSATRSPRPRLEQHRALAHADRVDGFGNIALDLTSEDLFGHPLAGAGRVSVGSRYRRRDGVASRLLRRRARGQRPLLRGLVGTDGGRDQPRRRQRAAPGPQRGRGRAGARP